MTDTNGVDSSDACFHCGEVVPAGSHFSALIDGVAQPMCCPGCQAVATLIAGSGLEQFYRQRTAFSERPAEREADNPWLVYDDPELADAFSERRPDGSVDARLLLGGVTCAACTWLVEHALEDVTGIRSATLNLQQSRLDIHFEPDNILLSDIFARVAQLGYRPRPFQSSARLEQAEAEYRRDLRRLGVAGFGMMQVGMFAIALHAGDLQGMELEYQGLLRTVSLLVASFVVFYSARTFFSTAWRHLRRGALVMDLPVALAIGLAWLASAWATVTGTGEVYFDSVVMFTFFLLLGRFLEARVRHRDARIWFDAESALPDAVRCLREGQWQTVARRQLQAGDRVLLPAGQVIAVDSEIVQGASAVREDAFNGEHLPRSVVEGDAVYAGTINVEAALEACVLGDYRDSRLAALQRSVSAGERGKPHLARLADRVASWFVAGVLLVTSLTAWYWSLVDPERALWIALSVLVISCPCALALATPAALAAAASALRSRGVIVRGENAIEALSRSTHMLFDKTGTLTQGELGVEDVRLLGELQQSQVLALSAALQQWSTHPVAAAFAGVSNAAGVDAVTYNIGAGLEGRWQGRRYRLGSEGFCRELCPALPASPTEPLYWVALVSDSRPEAWIGLSDATRPEAAAVVAAIQEAGLATGLLTGDASPQGQRLADQLLIPLVHRGLQPEQKMAQVRSLQASGAVVTMVGDGLNDAPVLSLADASFAVAGATDLARTQADFVLVGGNLQALVDSWRKARGCRRIILQNFGWALGYNLSAIPLAAMGYVPPWAAAIGMSLSSLLVVANSLRLHRID